MTKSSNGKLTKEKIKEIMGLDLTLTEQKHKMRSNSRESSKNRKPVSKMIVFIGSYFGTQKQENS